MIDRGMTLSTRSSVQFRLPDLFAFGPKSLSVLSLRITKIKLVAASALTLLLVAGLLWVSRDYLLTSYHVRALRYANERLSDTQRPMAWQVGAYLLRRWPDWGAISDRHEDALLGMGYYTRCGFPLTNRQVTAVRLATNARQRFFTEFSSIKVILNEQGAGAASHSGAEIVAPTAEMTNWSRLILDLDGRSDM